MVSVRKSGARGYAYTIKITPRTNPTSPTRFDRDRREIIPHSTAGEVFNDLIRALLGLLMLTAAFVVGCSIRANR